jgi:hypothetical protein
MRSKVAFFDDATIESPRVELKEDCNSLHFIRLVSSLDFADDDSFATVGEA